ncbi:MAG: hypothetical protein EHM21_13290 [Chloroflexi bacterium]|nr:MAG: hypothetical protein EHM21_13290 [Chloroflexota bacterium]
MDHVVYVDAKEDELGKLLAGSKRMVIRGATGRKLPYGRVQPGDRLFFIQNNGEGLIRAQASVTAVYNSEKLSEDESCRVVEDHQTELQLTPAQIKRWAGKRFLVLVTVGEVMPVTPFTIDRSAYGNMDDWLPVGEILSVRVN